MAGRKGEQGTQGPSPLFPEFVIPELAVPELVEGSWFDRLTNQLTLVPELVEGPKGVISISLT